MKKILFALLLPLQAMALTIGPEDTVYVVTPQRPVLSVKAAAEDLQTYLPRRTGAQIKVTTSAPAGSKAIYLAAKDGSKLKSDGFIIEVQGNRIDIYGNDSADYGTTQPFNFYFNVKSRGTFNGVCRFFDKYLDIDWVVPGELGLCMPPQSKVNIPDGKLQDEPKFIQRHIGQVYEPGNKPYFLDRNEYITEFRPALLWYAARLTFSSRMFPVEGCHSVSNYSLYANFGKSNPEYFSLQPNGTRGGQFGSLCWSNPDVSELFYKLADAYFSGKQPSAAGLKLPGNAWPMPFRLFKDEFMIDSTDSFDKNVCKCQRCKDKTPEEICEEVWKRIAEVAARIKVRHPDKKITSLAYPPKTEPPTFTLPDNILVRFAMPGPQAVYNKRANTYYQDMLKKWYGIVKEPIPLWFYYCAVDYGLPGIVEGSPEMMKIYLKQVQPYSDNLYFEYSSFKSQARRNYELYMIAKLMWNPDADLEELKAQYFRRGFGAGAEEMKKFYDRLEELWQKIIKATWDPGEERIPRLIYGGWRDKDSSYPVYKDIYTAEELTSWSRLLQKAKSKVPAGSKFAKRIDLIQKYVIDKIVEERELVMFANNAIGSTEYSMIVLENAPTEADWAQAAWQNLNAFADNRKEKLQAPGKFKLLLDKNNLYLRAELDEKLLDRSKTVKRSQSDISKIWLDNDFEVFVSNQSIVRQFLFNDLGQFTINDIIDRRACSYNGISEGVKVTAGRDKNKWTLDIALPNKLTGINSAEPGHCRFNITRARNIKDLPTEYSTWSSAVGFNSSFRSDMYGRLVWNVNAAMKHVYSKLAEKPSDTAMNLFRIFTFDKNPGKSWYNWHHSQTPAKPAYDAKHGHNKAGSLKIDFAAKTSASHSYWIPVRPGERIRITAWVKHTSGSVECSSRFMDEKNRWIDFYNSFGEVKVPSFNNWVKCSWEMTVPDNANISQMTAGFSSKDTPGTLWIDDVIIEKAGKFSAAEAETMQTYTGLAQKPSKTPMTLFKTFTFDKNPGKIWYNWRHSQTPARPGYDAKYGHDKPGSLKVDFAANTSASHSYWIPVNPGDRVRISAWVKHTTGSVDCSSRFMDAKNRWIGFSKYFAEVKVPSLGNWVKCSWEVVVPNDAKISQMTAGFTSQDTPATLWIDDVKIEKK